MTLLGNLVTQEISICLALRASSFPLPPPHFPHLPQGRGLLSPKTRAWGPRGPSSAQLTLPHYALPPSQVHYQEQRSLNPRRCRGHQLSLSPSTGPFCPPTSWRHLTPVGVHAPATLEAPTPLSTVPVYPAQSSQLFTRAPGFPLP